MGNQELIEITVPMFKKRLRIWKCKLWEMIQIGGMEIGCCFQNFSNCVEREGRCGFCFICEVLGKYVDLWGEKKFFSDTELKKILSPALNMLLYT